MQTHCLNPAKTMCDVCKCFLYTLTYVHTPWLLIFILSRVCSCFLHRRLRCICVSQVVLGQTVWSCLGTSLAFQASSQTSSGYGYCAEMIFILGYHKATIGLCDWFLCSNMFKHMYLTRWRFWLTQHHQMIFLRLYYDHFVTVCICVWWFGKRLYVGCMNVCTMNR